MVDDLSNYVVAIGTIALAIATFVLVIESRIQLKMLKNQNILQKYNTKPHLIIKQFSANKNTITITLKNIGGGLAKDIGLSTEFNPMFKHNEGLHLIPSKNVEYEGKKMTIVECFSYLKPHNNFSNILDKDEEQVFTTDKLFFELKEEGVGLEFLTIDKLINFFKDKKVDGFAFTIGLLYRDLSEEVVTYYAFKDLTFDISKHNFLEDCVNDNVRPYGFPLTFEQAYQLYGYFDGDMYRNAKENKS